MKKLIIVAASVLAASSVYAAPLTVCAAYVTAQDGTQIDTTAGFTAASGGAAGFVLNPFKPKCSANVNASIEQSEIALGVASGSKKGKNLFAGGTGGGGVKPTGTLYNTGVSSGDTDGQATAALAAASSS